MGSYNWGYKSPNMGYKYSYPASNPTVLRGYGQQPKALECTDVASPHRACNHYNRSLHRVFRV